MAALLYAGPESLAEEMAYAEDLVPQGCPDLPRKPDLPRYFPAQRLTRLY
jgi:hypothetical protein